VSSLAHVMCEQCCISTIWMDAAEMLTNAHKGRLCCYCGKVVNFAVIVHRYPDAVPCRGIHKP